MIDIENIFRYMVPDIDKLAADGFVYSDGEYTKNEPIMDGAFYARISVNDAGEIGLKVYETESGEEYVLVHVDGAAGGFVGSIREECEIALAGVAKRCFNVERLKAEQTGRVVKYIAKSFGVQPEFLWEKSPDSAAFRRKDNGKWFAVIMRVDKSRLGLQQNGAVEIINLKDAPENVKKRVDGKRFFGAYHMNKTHWYTVCLDGGISDEKIQSLIDASYESVGGKGKINMHYNIRRI